MKTIKAKQIGWCVDRPSVMQHIVIAVRNWSTKDDKDLQLSLLDALDDIKWRGGMKRNEITPIYVEVDGE